MKTNVESALKSLAKRPKLVTGIDKGTEFHKLKTVGQVSGGFIRQLMWAGVAEKSEDGIVTFCKGMKKALDTFLKDSPPEGKGKPKRTHSEGPTTRVPKKALGKPDSRKNSDRKRHVSDVEDTSELPSKKGKKETPYPEGMTKREQRQAAKAERMRIRAEKRAIKQRNKAEKAEASKAGPVVKKAKGKLLRPVKGIAANHKIELEYQDGFWWASDKEGRYRIATSNIKFE